MCAPSASRHLEIFLPSFRPSMFRRHEFTFTFSSFRWTRLHSNCQPGSHSFYRPLVRRSTRWPARPSLNRPFSEFWPCFHSRICHDSGHALRSYDATHTSQLILFLTVSSEAYRCPRLALKTSSSTPLPSLPRPRHHPRLRRSLMGRPLPRAYATRSQSASPPNALNIHGFTHIWSSYRLDPVRTPRHM